MQVNKFFYKDVSCQAFNNSVIIPFCEMIVVGAGLFAIFVALVLLSKADKDFE